MYKIEIEKGIPYNGNKGKQQQLHEQLLKMGVGDSFLLEDKQSKRVNIYNAINHIRNVMGKKEMSWTSAKWDEGHVRFWRIS